MKSYGEGKGVLKGLYPGHERTNTPEGEYTLKGDLHNVPNAPRVAYS